MARTAKPVPLASIFAALADSTRLRLLNLMAGREVCVCYFVEILRQGQPKISRHLAYLQVDALSHHTAIRSRSRLHPLRHAGLPAH
jgi:DNA-binding transcriptional ArsR family regulator